MRMSFRGRLFSSSTLALAGVVALGVSAAPSMAQAVNAESSDAAKTTAPLGRSGAEAEGGEILVTARKRAEDVLKTPVTVNVVTSADIETRQIVSVTDLAANTPGLNINNSSSGRQDRSFQSLIVRGITPGQVNNITASTFIDGVPVGSTTAIETVDDPARVELLKGPQSAYFGRQTFAGALNIVTKTPGDTFAGSISALGGTRDNYDLAARISGPIFGEKLGFGASVRRFERSGSYKNVANPDQTLGDQQTFSTNLSLVARPTESLTIKALGIYIKDHDGPSADGRVATYSASAPGLPNYIQSQANCTLSGYSAANTTPVITNRARVNYNAICGRVPGLLPGSLGINATLDPTLVAFLAAGNGTVLYPGAAGLTGTQGRVVSADNGVKGYGLRRAYYHAHLTIDYEVPGSSVTLSSLTGYNSEYFSELDDLDNYDGRRVPNTTTAAVGFPAPNTVRSFYDFPFLVERTNKDFSQEFRATSGQSQRFRWTIGASYLRNTIRNSQGGGNGAVVSAISATARNVTKGAFFGLAFDITDELTVNVEGRYQIDKLYSINGQAAAPSPTTLLIVPAFTTAAAVTFKNFLPRAILQWQATPDLMAYASYAKGVNPGTFNNALGSPFLTAAGRAELAAIGLPALTKAEKLDNYEVGLKGRLAGGMIRYALSAYYANWTNQLSQSSFVLPAFNATGVALTTNGLVQIQTFNYTASHTKLKGIELDTTINPMDGLDLNFAAAVNDSDIRNYIDARATIFTGVSDFRGKQLPFNSKYSASAGAQYSFKLHSAGDDDLYVRADGVYKSGLYSDASNTTKTAPQKIVNVRSGVHLGSINLEAFVTNLFNNRAYTSISNNNLLLSPTSTAAPINPAPTNSYLSVGLPTLRTFGVRAKYTF